MKKSNKAKKALLNCVDLFAGAGGFSLAARNTGLAVIAAVEMKRHACETYRANLIKNGETTLYQTDMLQLDPEAVKNLHFPEGIECDLVLGGPPCQGFSVHRINNKGVGDPRNQLILRYFDFVKTLQSKVFLMENVPGILWKRHSKFLEEFYEQGRAAGYNVWEPVVLDARDYGVPQRRKRVFILGVRSGVKLELKWPPDPTHSGEVLSNLEGKLPWVVASSVFERPLHAEDENNIHMKHSPALVEVFKSTPINGGSRRSSNRSLPCHRDHNGHSDVYGRIDPSQPGPTMTTACINPSKGRFVHPTEHHGITARHAARFQTFPDSYVFKGGLIASGEQIGNAVPVRLGEVLLSSIAEALILSETQQIKFKEGVYDAA